VSATDDADETIPVDEVRRLVQEERSLRRVATLVATAGPSDDVLTAICREASDQLGGHEVTVLRFDSADTVVAVATHGGPIPPGIRAVHPAGSLPGRVATTGGPVRVDEFDDVADAELVRPYGIRAAVAVPIFIDGRIWGMFSASSPTGPLPGFVETRLAGFAQLTWAAIANVEARRVLARSRARVIAAGDEARRRVQRDVHDGAQQRLVHSIIALKLARDRLAGGGDARELVAEALANAEEANRQLRDVVRGILPAALTRSGLEAGIDALVADCTTPVELRLSVPRLPPAVETTGYFTVAEAVTNAVKHARASIITVTGAVVDGAGGGELVLGVEDDGVGGADAERGTGLTGLADRIAASEGTFTVDSPEGGGTRVGARIPIRDGDEG
jgi:signal transduction histidine kinase